ncbi:Folylpolyglutamate synthase [Lachnellula subtilissima]|uniref:Folylpolyglutamate synthase n=1 Tax=Lachnellula subtilissima TaxID=602034 RepID=A0A8H8RW08_9HELO|nr:Folylpolyglutamate synthase [Lachnellula subtilissima]
MAAPINTRTYDDAVDLLNSLQTPYHVLKQRRDAGIRIDKTANEEMRRCLHHIGYSQQDLEKLNIVHVAGTKGKGSTCAYVDSILSQYRKSRGIPKNVGLFTSPHLVAVRERIRINSAPISAETFAKYFFDVWDKLETASEHKPVYFRYLTLMSYHVFLQEGVDAAVYEVGVGGEYDSTNIVDRPAATGISTLGIDHTFSLGDTIESIAWHKAGIQKKDVPSFTVRQKPGALEVVESRAAERGVKSFTVLDQDPRLQGVRIRPDAEFQKSNASLAIALADTVLQKMDPSYALPVDSLPKEYIDGLEKVVWRGRCETKVEGDITWYLDGAHTAESIMVAAKWFSQECSNKSGTRALIFNQQGHREAIELLEGLHTAITEEGTVKFDYVVFCPTVLGGTSTKRDFDDKGQDSTAVSELTLQKAFAEKWKALDSSTSTTIQVLPTIEDAFKYVRNLQSVESGNQTSTLITGSVRLVGTALATLEDVDAL